MIPAIGAILSTIGRGAVATATRGILSGGRAAAMTGLRSTVRGAPGALYRASGASRVPIIEKGVRFGGDVFNSGRNAYRTVKKANRIANTVRGRSSESEDGDDEQQPQQQSQQSERRGPSDTMWVTDGKKSRRVKRGEIPEGFTAGRGQLAPRRTNWKSQGESTEAANAERQAEAHEEGLRSTRSDSESTLKLIAQNTGEIRDTLSEPPEQSKEESSFLGSLLKLGLALTGVGIAIQAFLAQGIGKMVGEIIAKLIPSSVRNIVTAPARIGSRLLSGAKSLLSPAIGTSAGVSLDSTETKGIKAATESQRELATPVETGGGSWLGRIGLRDVAKFAVNPFVSVGQKVGTAIANSNGSSVAPVTSAKPSPATAGQKISAVAASALTPNSDQHSQMALLSSSSTLNDMYSMMKDPSRGIYVRPVTTELQAVATAASSNVSSQPSTASSNPRPESTPSTAPEKVSTGQGGGSIRPVTPAPAFEGLGGLSALYESGTRGSSAVGFDSTGGTSYGKYQIASRTGTMDQFMDYIKDKNPEVYSRLSAAGPADTGKNGAFAQEWKRIAAEGGFGDLEHDFIKKTHYDVANSKIKSDSLRSQIEGSKALQDVLWSTAVQHGGGGGAGIFNKVYREGMSDDELIKAIYAERGTRFGRSTDKVRASVQARFADESNRALAMSAQPSSNAQILKTSNTEAQRPVVVVAPAPAPAPQQQQKRVASGANGKGGTGTPSITRNPDPPTIAYNQRLFAGSVA